MSAWEARVVVACPACARPMMLRTDVAVDGGGKWHAQGDLADRAVLLHLRLSCDAVARRAPEPDVEYDVEPEPEQDLGA